MEERKKSSFNKKKFKAHHEMDEDESLIEHENEGWDML
jgi:hypothetical protein